MKVSVLWVIFSAAIICICQNCLLFMQKWPKSDIFRFHFKVTMHVKYSKMMFFLHYNAFLKLRGTSIVWPSVDHVTKTNFLLVRENLEMKNMVYKC